MTEKMNKKTQVNLTIMFAILSIAFVILMAVNREFFQWSFERHHNTLSWYIRPLFIIPLCWYAYKRSGLGISVTVFAMLTSMMWFPKPGTVDPLVIEFLEMEKEHLTSNWTMSKAIMSTVPFVMMYMLCLAFWKRSLKWGGLIMVAIAVAKVMWSVMEGGESGTSIIIPAVVGLVICSIVLYYFIYKRKSKLQE